MTARLRLRTYEVLIVFAPGGKADPRTGYDAFVPLIDSGNSLYVWTGPKFRSVVASTLQAVRRRDGGRSDPRVLRVEQLESASF